MEAYIYEAIRTGRGSIRKNGSLLSVAPVELMRQLFHALEQRTPHITEQLEDIILGCVTQIEAQGTNIAKTAALYAELPDSIPGMTVTRLCTSGLDAIAIAAAKVQSGQASLLAAGGVESVSTVPMFADKGAWFADPIIANKSRFVHMGISADLMASLYNISREEMDLFAANSHKKAAVADANGHSSDAMIPIVNESGELLLQEDENIRPATTLEQYAALPPVFEQFLTEQQRKLIEEQFPELEAVQFQHTAGNSPTLADGAALLVIGAKQNDPSLTPRAKIVGALSVASHPMLLLGGQTAAEKLMEKHSLSFDDLDVIEFYEAYSATAVKAQKDWQVSDERFNPNGGVIATGHALGATGAILVVSLIEQLERKNGRYGLVTLSGGGGVGTAMIIERL